MKKIAQNVFYFLILNSCIGISSVSSAPIGLSDFAADAQIIDFEGPSTALPSIPGISFPREGIINSPGWFSSTSSFNSTFFGDKVFANLVSRRYSDIAIEFLDPVQAVGGWLGQIDSGGGGNPETITFSIFGIAGLLDEIIVDLPTIGFETPVFVGLSSDIGITRVEWRNQNTGFFGVDNVIYGAVSVPEPSTFMLLLIGMLSFVWFLRPLRLKRMS